MNLERRKKLEKTIRKLTSDFITSKLPDEDKIFGIINIGEIALSPDSSYLDINVSSFIKKDLLTKTLAKHAHIIQRII
jgi:ribosome-binding factor A